MRFEFETDRLLRFDVAIGLLGGMMCEARISHRRSPWRRKVELKQAVVRKWRRSNQGVELTTMQLRRATHGADWGPWKTARPPRTKRSR